jgi:MFS family permease
VASRQAAGITAFTRLLRENRNFRWAWIGQVISEIGDNYNNIAVMALALEVTGSGLAVALIFLARAVPMMIAGPLAGVLLDRMDRRKIMIASDLVRAVVASLFIFGVPQGRTWLLYVLSGLLMFASPFFTAGRSAIMPAIATEDELHTANALTQMTRWTSQSIGSFLGGAWIAGFGYELAFVANAGSFILSAICIGQLRLPAGVTPTRASIANVKPWRDYKAGLSYIWAAPLIFGIVLTYVGWATGGGAAQVLFSLFGENVFHRGPVGIGLLWGITGVALVFGAIFAHWLRPQLSFERYKHVISIAYLIHGAGYVLFALAPTFAWAMWWISVSRFMMGISNVLNTGHLFSHVTNEYRGRVWATLESWTWTTMMVSISIAGVASEYASPRTIGVWSGIASSTTGIWWAWANWKGKLPEPAHIESTEEEDDACNLLEGK